MEFSDGTLPNFSKLLKNNCVNELDLTSFKFSAKNSIICVFL